MRKRQYYDEKERAEMEAEQRAEAAEAAAVADRERAEAIARMEPWTSPALVEPVETGWHVTVKGRISSVRWLETAPYQAHKVRGDRGFWNYELTLPSAEAEELIDRLEGSTLARKFRDDSLQEDTGVWCEAHPVFASVPVHPAHANFADLLQRNPQHRIGGVIFRDIPPDGNECHQFALEQIRKLQRQYASHCEASEIAAIYADVWQRGGDAYEQHRPRLLVLNQRGKR